MSLICKNALLVWPEPDNDFGRIERVLWVDPQSSLVFTIRLFDRLAWPKNHDLQELEHALTQGVSRLLEQDPYAKDERPAEVATSVQKERQGRAWQVIAPILVEPDIYVSDLRGKLVASACQRSKVAGNTVNAYLRTYWQAGLRASALVAGLHRCGGRGRPRVPKEAKRGRPRRHADDPEIGIGINVNPDILKKIRQGKELFYDHRKEPSMDWALQKTWESFFSRGVKLVAGVPTPILIAPGLRPTIGQFRYYVGKLLAENPTLADEARRGPRRNRLSGRAILDNSTRHSFGPGHVFQIDATIADLHLVSSLDRHKRIGRPTLYLLVDVFSRLIVGFHVTLESASYRAATLALENAASDKEIFCRRLGVEISGPEWPSRHLCSTLLADRGELASQFAGVLVSDLGLTVQHTAPYRADLKGIIERRFRMVNDIAIRWISGNVDRGSRERGERDPRLDAIMTLEEFRRLMILFILEHNLGSLPDDYPRDEFQVASEVEARPYKLWEYGVLRRNRPQVIDHDRLRMCLLPRAQAIVSAKGIQYGKMRYTCDRAVREQWFESARIRGKTYRQTIAFDPRWTDEIYLLPGGEKAPASGLERCVLIEGQDRYVGRDLLEVDAEEEDESRVETRARGVDQQTRADFNARRGALVAEAKGQTKEADKRAASSARSRTSGLRENRQEERERERQAARTEFNTSMESTAASATGMPPNVIPITPTIPVDPAAVTNTVPTKRPAHTSYVPPPSYGDILDETWDEPN